MAYRNGTYIAFHAEGSTDPTASDIKYYRLMKMWHENDDIDFKFINSHDKVGAVRDTSKKATLMASLRARLNDSKNMVLIVGEETRYDTDWVPYEIEYAVDKCKIPLIVVYTGYAVVRNPSLLASLWPAALNQRIANRSVRAIHVPFKQRAIDDAIRQFNFCNVPSGSLVFYSTEAHRSFGIAVTS